jgi:hypothetical protein
VVQAAALHRREHLHAECAVVDRVLDRRQRAIAILQRGLRDPPGEPVGVRGDQPGQLLVADPGKLAGDVGRLVLDLRVRHHEHLPVVAAKLVHQPEARVQVSQRRVEAHHPLVLGGAVVSALAQQLEHALRVPCR